MELFSQSPHKFDLVITDMTMPELTGDILVREMKKIRPDLPIILITGFSEKVNEKNPMKLDVDQILMKPVLKKDLGRAILNSMSKHSLKNKK